MFRRPADLYDRIFTERRVERVERFIIYMAAAGLLIHVAVIAAGQLGLGSERLAELAGPGYLSALYTPFSFILVFEVFGLVLALSRSFSTSIAVQYQIMALIFVRRIFGDIGHLGDVDDWTFGNEWVQWLAVDMVGSLALFLLVTIFLHISRQTRGEEVTEDVEAFIAIKKAITLVMALVAIAVGVWAFGESTWQVFSHLWHGDGLVIDINFVLQGPLYRSGLRRPARPAGRLSLQLGVLADLPQRRVHDLDDPAAIVDVGPAPLGCRRGRRSDRLRSLGAGDLPVLPGHSGRRRGRLTVTTRSARRRSRRIGRCRRGRARR
jgi:hypothetical protein